MYKFPHSTHCQLSVTGRATGYLMLVRVLEWRRHQHFPLSLTTFFFLTQEKVSQNLRARKDLRDHSSPNNHLVQRFYFTVDKMFTTCDYDQTALAKQKGPSSSSKQCWKIRRNNWLAFYNWTKYGQVSLFMRENKPNEYH